MSDQFKEQFKFDVMAFLANLTERPGVYQMHNDLDEVIYVGKAKNLKRRVSSYFVKRHDTIKTQAMVAQVARISVTVTDTESEALILENTLIKRLNPRYNILFRDDKSYPYVYVSSGKDYPSLSFHRGAKRRQGRYFGPFPNAGAVHQTLQALQKIFPVRQCAESVFNHRSRPCLQYQIKRCSGPCVGLISQEDYAEDVRLTLMFLEGKSFDVIEELGQQMQGASEALEFEKAGVLRDRISALRTIQSQHLINQPGAQDLDVLAVQARNHQVCVSLMIYRGGHLWGSENYFPKSKFTDDTCLAETLGAFISQHYDGHPIPKTLLINQSIDDQAWLQDWLTQKKQQAVTIKQPSQATAKGLIQLALTNGESALKQHLNQKASQWDRVVALQEALHLPRPPKVMECFDISHTMGEQAVASCVVFMDGIPASQAYRKFNITGITGGDDYAAMHQALSRRYQRLKTEQQDLPDLVIVDGGKGQLSQAIAVLRELELDQLPLVSVAKGEGRKAGLEVLYTPHDLDGIDLDTDDIALHLINHIRDEAHRFAITGHRQRRQKAQTHSQLEDIPGVGPKTRKRLLTHFGGLSQVKNAAASELTKVKGVSASQAQKIYDFYHGDV